MAQQSRRYYVADADITEIEINLASYSSTGLRGQETFNVNNRITCSALQFEAQELSSIQSIVNLAAAERVFLDLAADEDLNPVP